jgi:hypothetical protein
MVQAVQRHQEAVVAVAAVALAQQVRLHSKMEALTHLVVLVALVVHHLFQDLQSPTQVAVAVELLGLLLKPAAVQVVAAQEVLMHKHLKMAQQTWVAAAAVAAEALLQKEMALLAVPVLSSSRFLTLAQLLSLLVLPARCLLL